MSHAKVLVRKHVRVCKMNKVEPRGRYTKLMAASRLKRHQTTKQGKFERQLSTKAERGRARRRRDSACRKRSDDEGRRRKGKQNGREGGNRHRKQEEIEWNKPEVEWLIITIMSAEQELMSCLTCPVTRKRSCWSYIRNMLLTFKKIE